MQSLRMLVAAVGSASLLLTAPLAHSQQEGLINVEISNVANDIARELSVEVSQIPVTVQAPIDVAANVCGVEVNVLSQSGGGQGGCQAKSTSSALNQIVQRQLKGG